MSFVTSDTVVNALNWFHLAKTTAANIASTFLRLFNLAQLLLVSCTVWIANFVDS